MTDEAKKPLGRILLQQRALTQAELEEALARGNAGGAPLATRLTENGTVSEIAALKALSEQSGVPGIDLNQICLRLSDLTVVPREVAVRHKLLPVLVREDRIFVAMAAPTDQKIIDEIEFVSGKRVFPYVSLTGLLAKVIAAAYDMRDRGEAYYVGPHCPAEVLRKVGISRPGELSEEVRISPREDPRAEDSSDDLFISLRHDEPTPVPPSPQRLKPRGDRVAIPPPSAEYDAESPRLPRAPAPATFDPVPTKRAAEAPAWLPPTETAAGAELSGPHEWPTLPPPAERSQPGRPPTSSRDSWGGGSVDTLDSHLQASKRFGWQAPPSEAQVASETRPSPLRAPEEPDAVRPGDTAPPPPGYPGARRPTTRPRPTPLPPTMPPGALAPVPAVLADEEPDRPHDAHDDLSDDAEESETTARRGQKTVLVVDEDPELRAAIRQRLEERSYRVVEASAGREAMRLIEEDTPALMILDSMLPEIHGFDIARRVKEAPDYEHIPIVLTSSSRRGWRFAEDVKASYKVEAFLEKPLRPEEVVRIVDGALNRAPQPGEATRDPEEGERLLALGIAAYQAGEIDTAIEHLVAGTKADPLAFRLHFHLGLLFGRRGQVYDAIQELETATEINTVHFGALKNLAVLYQKAGFRNKAVETWERAITLAPDDETRASIKEHITRLA